MKAQPYDATGGNSAQDELRDAVRMSARYMPRGGALTFRPQSASGLHAEWRQWLAERFEACLGPHLVTVYQHSMHMRVREAAELDLHLGVLFSPDERRAMSSAGLQIMEELEGAQQVRQLGKLRLAIENQLASGYFITVFGMISAMFNFSQAACVLAYLYCEWRSGTAALAHPELRVTEELFQPFALEAESAIRAALTTARDPGGSTQPFADVVEQ